MTLRPSLLVLALAVAASPAVAQSAPQTAPQGASQTRPYAGPDAYRDQRALPGPADRDALLKARGEAYHRAGDDKQTEEELRATRALNDEIAAQNALADKADADARLDYDAALARHEVAVRQGEEQARAAAEATRAAQDQYDRDYAAWREQVRLCQSGVRAACGTPVGPAR
ncbi:hypothetical protein [Brevundimonas sp.]|uniref:hypothetical protein n=1 Tax=Brevundimonas sp. TaxID=1871086 RepID=UPI003B003420